MTVSGLFFGLPVDVRVVKREHFLDQVFWRDSATVGDHLADPRGLGLALLSGTSSPVRGNLPMANQTSAPPIASPTMSAQPMYCSVMRVTTRRRRSAQT